MIGGGGVSSIIVYDYRGGGGGGIPQTNFNIGGGGSSLKYFVLKNVPGPPAISK